MDGSARRFTTLEGWRELPGGLLVLAGSAASAVAGPGRGAARASGLDALFAARASSTHEWPFGSFPPTRAASPVDEGAAWQGEKAAPGAALDAAPRPAPPFHSFTNKKKWLVVVTIGLAGLFSGLSSNIYFPSLDAIAQDLGVSLGAVSLTITSYLVIQGISPLFWGPLSDSVGRRPIYLASFAVYIVANVVLAFSPSFPVLLVFRGLQSAGSASTVSIGNGVIQDIASPAERGAYISFYQAIRNFSIAVGPVLGGLLAKFFGFRSVFVFLVTASSLVVIIIVLYLPETLRAIAGDGSVRLRGIYQPLVQRLARAPAHHETAQPTLPPRRRVTHRTFLEPLRLLGQKDILATLIFGGTVYSVWSMVVASTAGLFKARFALDELGLGLAFLPNGLGTIVGSAVAGKLMTREFLRCESAYMERNPAAAPPSTTKKHLPLDFPIEHARLRHVPVITVVFAVATAAYGASVLPAEHAPVVARPGWIAVPLLLQFVIAAASNAVFAINTALVADLCPGKGAGATAINNLVRCGMGAAGVAGVDALVAAFEPAAAFIGLALLTAASAVLLAVEWFWGMQWRRQRAEAAEAVDAKARRAAGAV